MTRQLKTTEVKRLNNGASSDKANINAQTSQVLIYRKYEEFLCPIRRATYAVTAWAEVKSFWKNEIVTVEDENGEYKRAMSLLIRRGLCPIP